MSAGNVELNSKDPMETTKSEKRDGPRGDETTHRKGSKKGKVKREKEKGHNKTVSGKRALPAAGYVVME